MKPVKTYPKFRCDFCKKKATKYHMEKHEVICWYNPKRKCRTCEGSGLVEVCYEGGCGEVPCEDCVRAKEIQDSIKNTTF